MLSFGKTWCRADTLKHRTTARMPKKWNEGKKVKHTTCLRASSRCICWSKTAAKMKLCNGRLNTSEQPKEHAKIREWGCAVLRNMFGNIKVCSSQCTYVQHLYKKTRNSVVMQHPNELDAKLPQMPHPCHKTIKTERVGDGTFSSHRQPTENSAMMHRLCTTWI